MAIINPDRPYRRIEIDKIFTKVKAEMHKSALERGLLKGLDKAVYRDIYTGKELIGGDKYDYEHLRSSEEIYNKYKNILSDDQIAQVVNCQENVAVTHTFINKSKGKRRMEDWLLNSANVSTNEIDIDLTLKNLKKADEGIERIVKSFKK